jgi:hypothetical protein
MVGKKDSAVETPWQVALPVLRNLSAALDAGNEALARQDLKSFEEHVAVQVQICDALVEAGVLSNPAGPARETLQRLDHQKRVYSALLRRARTYAQVLLTLYHSREGYSSDSPTPLPASTWSSEA